MQSGVGGRCRRADEISRVPDEPLNDIGDSDSLTGFLSRFGEDRPHSGSSLVVDLRHALQMRILQEGKRASSISVEADTVEVRAPRPGGGIGRRGGLKIRCRKA